MSTQKPLTAPAIAFLRVVRSRKGVGVGGSYDDLRISRALHRRGLLTIEESAAGSSYWVLTETGKAVIDP